jgi:hypothetical protein
VSLLSNAALRPTPSVISTATLPATRAPRARLPYWPWGRSSACSWASGSQG